jgi:hypothetical protein
MAAEALSQAATARHQRALERALRDLETEGARARHHLRFVSAPPPPPTPQRCR